MNTIQEAIDSGACTHLGPVTVEKDYGLNTKAKTALRTLLIKDVSGKTMLKLWGTCAKSNVSDGDHITVRAVGDNGTIESTEYQGKMQLNANNCIIEVVGAGNKATKAGVARHAATTAAKGDLAPMTKLIDYGLACVRYGATQAQEKGQEFGDALQASVFGTAMYGFKEGRRLVAVPKPAPAPAPPPEPEPEPEVEAVGYDEEDSIPF